MGKRSSRVLVAKVAFVVGGGGTWKKKCMPSSKLEPSGAVSKD